MSRTPSYEYEVLHQFEAIFRDGEHKTQAATRDYQRVWENVINNPPEDGVTPVVVYRMNGRTCAAIAGLDDLVDNEECAMEIARLAARVTELEAENAKHRSTQAAIYRALGTANPNRDDWPKEIGDIRQENAKLRKCVEAADELSNNANSVCNSFNDGGLDGWEIELLRKWFKAYDAARAEVDK